MDFDLRQWLLILGPLFIIAVLLHGYLRMRAGQNQIRMKLDKSFLNTADEDVDVDELHLLKAELPNGGARVITSEADGEEDVPVLVEPVDLPSISATDIHLPDPEELLEEPSPATYEEPAPVAEIGEPEPETTAMGKAPPARKREPVPEKFVIINVLALADPFPGQQLLELLMENGLTFGEMDIFHRRREDGATLFSLASAVEPGTFDMKTMGSLSIPGVTLFMRVHELADPVSALDDMLSVADAIALELNGEVRDETRSVMTPQTVEHCRQSIREFQFRYSA